MKNALAVILGAALAGCASDGSFDAAGFDSAVKTTQGAYDRYQATQHPQPTYTQPLVTPDGRVIYPTSP